MTNKIISFEGARNFKIKGGNFGEVDGDVVNVNLQGSGQSISHIPWNHLPLGTRHRRRLGNRNEARRRSTSSIPPPSPTSSRSSDSSDNEGPDSGAGGLSGRYPAWTSTERHQRNLSSHSVPPPTYTDDQAPPPTTTSQHAGDPLSPLSVSLGFGLRSPTTPLVSPSHQRISQTAYPPAGLPAAIVASTPSVHPQTADESPATRFTRLQAQHRHTTSPIRGYGPIIVTYTPSQSPQTPQQRLQRTPTQAFSATPTQAALLTPRTRRNRPLPPTPQPLTPAVAAPRANYTLPMQTQAPTLSTAYRTSDITEAGIGHQSFLDHSLPHGASVNRYNIHPQTPRPRVHPSQPPYATDLNYYTHDHYTAHPTPVLPAPPYLNPSYDSGWNATVGSAYGPFRTPDPNFSPRSGRPD